MTKQLYEEALADVKKVKEIAEANAQRAILEAVTPRIRDLIERELMRESSDDDDDESQAVKDDRPILTDKLTAKDDDDRQDHQTAANHASDLADESVHAVEQNESISKVDAAAGGDQEYELSLESSSALSSLVKASKLGAEKRVEKSIREINEAIKEMNAFGSNQPNAEAKMSKLVARVEELYDYVQESIGDSDKKSTFELSLETQFKELNHIQESMMSQKTNRTLNEEDVTLKLTGLPDDIDLESIGVDLITGEGDEGEESPEESGDEEGEELELDMDEEGEEGSEEEDSGEDLDLDMGEEGEEGSEEEDSDEESDDDLGEALNLSDNTIVEIDESMLRSEIMRMKSLREAKKKKAKKGKKDNSPKGSKLTSKSLSAFGGGKSKGKKALTKESAWHESEELDRVPMGEADDDDEINVNEVDVNEVDVNEVDVNEVGLGERGDRSMRSASFAKTGFERSKTTVPSISNESVRSSVTLERKIQERAKARAVELRQSVREALECGNTREARICKEEYARVAKRFNESLTRMKAYENRLAESANASRRGSSENVRPTRSAESKAVETLRNKLAETNLINAKLLFTNKLLQNESLTSRQKAQVIEQLDAAKTLNEAKLVYESLAKTLTGATRVNESKERKVLGSSSRVTKPASTQSLNEGYEADRWAKLAGINK